MTEQNDIDVLIVDDDPGLLKTMVRNLNRRGFRTRSAESGEAALEIMAGHTFDVVLLDQNMPGMTGMDTLEQMEETLSEIPPVIMVTAADSRHLAVEFMKSHGAADFIPKPVNQDLLEGQIRSAVTTRDLQKARDRERASRIAAEESGRMKDWFLATMGHEFNTPLNAVSGIAQLLQTKLDMLEKEEIQRYLSEIKTASDTLNRLLNDLLRATPGEINSPYIPEAFYISSALNDLIQVFSEKAQKKGLAFNCDPMEDFPLVYADPDKFIQIAGHLLDNALKFTPDGKVSLSLSLADGFVNLSVRDTGTGIAQDYWNVMFERFWKMDRSGSIPGAGLGLYLARFWAEKMDGKIWVDSQPGVGTNMVLAIPLWDDRLGP